MEAAEHRSAKEADEPERVEVEEPPEEGEAEAEILRWGSGAATIAGARLLDDGGREIYHLHTGDDVAFEIDIDAPDEIDDFVFGVGVFTTRGVECWGTNTDLEGLRPERLAGRATVRVRCPGLRLAPGEYLVDLAVHARDGAPFDYWRKAFAFTVTSRERGVGLYLPSHEWEFAGGVAWREPEEK